MKRNRILYILLILLVIAMIALITLKVNSNLKDNNKLSDIIVSNIIFEDIYYEYDENKNETEFNLSAINNTMNKVRLNDYNILIYDEDDNLIDIYSFNNSFVLYENGLCTMGFVIDMEYKNSYKLKIELPEFEIISNDTKDDIDVS